MSRTQRAIALASILVATFANYLTVTVLTIALRPVADELHGSIDDAAWVMIAPQLVSGLFTPAFGKLADRLGRRRIFRFGVVLFGLGTLWCALAPTLGWLIAARVLTGIGTAAAMPSGIALATSLFPPDERSVPMGYWTSVTAFAPAIGVVVGGYVIEHISWRYLFWGQLPFVLGSLIAAFSSVPESEGSEDGSFDHAGALLLGAAFFLLTLATNRANLWGWTSGLVFGSIVLSALAMAGVVYVEKRVANPVVPVRTLASEVVRLSLAGRSLMYAVHMGSFVLMPLFLLDVGHQSPSAIAWMLLARPLAMGVAAPLSGVLGRRFGPAVVLVAGVGAMLFGIGALMNVAVDVTTIGLIPSLVGMGLGLGLSQTVTASEIAERTAPEDLGAASAMLAISTSLAGSLGSAGLLAIATRPGLAPLEAFHDAFLGCTVVCALALIVALMHVRARRREVA